ncbi:MAG TPA: transglycosylase domain-containing protein [Flavobacterium sp.]|nr:transglycosylase domain-containing protein [Flavobacterium sp.]
MKNLFKIVLIILLIFFSGYAYLLSDYNPIFNNRAFISLKQSIESAKREDLSSMDILYFEIHQSDERKVCPCKIITNSVDPYRHQIFSKNKLYAAKIKRSFSSNDCLKQHLLNGEFLHNIVGVKKASDYYFQKPIERLNEKEKITLLVMLQNPALYNPERRTELIERKVKSYQEKLYKQRGK